MNGIRAMSYRNNENHWFNISEEVQTFHIRALVYVEDIKKIEYLLLSTS